MPSQQPVEQLPGVHTHDPPWHSVPAGQAMQATPFEPQAPFVFPAWQTPFWQQPEAQLVGVHTQDPPWHSVPAGHVIHAVPAVPQN